MVNLVSNPYPQVIVIAGPTGIGKTALGIALAQRFDGEIVSADSRQIYRYMDIGTAKPTLPERAAAPHHLIDIVDPDQPFSLADYQERASAAIADIHARGKRILLVGGTGQYITALLEGWSAPEVPPDLALRAELESFTAEHGADKLVERLKSLDPESGERIDPHNLRRVIRAIEVCILTGKPFSAQREKHPPGYDCLEIGLTMDREALYTRLDARIDQMMAAGLLGEVKMLQARGYAPNLPAMSSLGYSQLGDYLRGTLTLEQSIAEFKRATRMFVRRQYTWFRHHGALQWIEVPDQIPTLVDQWLQRKG